MRNHAFINQAWMAYPHFPPWFSLSLSWLKARGSGGGPLFIRYGEGGYPEEGQGQQFSVIAKLRRGGGNL